MSQTQATSLSRSHSAAARVGLFVLLTYAITWGTQGPAALAKLGVLPGPVERYLPWVGVGLFGPLLAALCLSFGEGRWLAVRALFKQLRWPAAGFRWALLAVLLSGSILSAGLMLASFWGYAGPWVYLPKVPATWLALVLVPFLEEIGWRGYAYPRLQQRFGALSATLLLGLIWAFWHIPMFLLVDMPAAGYAWCVPFFLGGSMVFTWLYQRPGGGLPLMVLAHIGVHLNNSHQALPSNLTPLVVHAVGWCVVALIVLPKLRR